MLLGRNSKTKLQDGNECITYCLHLSPHKESVQYGGENMCKYASPGCVATCLIHTGLHRMNKSKQRRIERTLWLLKDRESFLERLEAEISKAFVRASKKNLKLAIRLDGVSDYGLSMIFCKIFDQVIFYEYTKDFTRIADWVIERKYWKNLFLTFSWSGKNIEEVLACLRAGVNVAVPFWPEVPEGSSFFGYPIVDGTYDDRRFMDPTTESTIIGLKFKGSKKKRDFALQQGFCQKSDTYLVRKHNAKE